MATFDPQGERVRVAAEKVRAGIDDKLGDLWWWFMIRGGLAIALGVFALFWPTLSLTILAIAVGIYLLADGALGLFGSLKSGERGGYLVQSIVSLVIGAVLLFWPGRSLRLLLIVFGIGALVMGVSQIMVARKLSTADPERGVIMTIGVIATIVGLVLVLWPGSGIVTISWLIAAASLIIGAALIYIASRLRRAERRF
jgi:uncharacterized membrane protein HdeD (DUF308 family)